MQSNYLYKIYIALGSFILITAVLFLYGFNVLHKSSEALAKEIADKNKEFAALELEQRSYDAAKKDLKTLADKPLQPDNLFSQDTRVVREIKELEDLASSLDLSLTLAVAGTSSSAKKVPQSTGDIYLIPYNMTLEGPFSKIVSFTELVEHLDFITHVTNVNINASTGALVRAVLSANFYIKK